MSNNATPGAFSPESWEYARGYSAVLGAVPSSFTSVMRSLIQEHSQGLTATTGTSKYFILRLLKSPSLFAPFFFAAKNYHPDLVGPDDALTPDKVSTIFTPGELAYLLALVYMSRRADELCDKDEWGRLRPTLLNSVDAGYLIGRAIPAIGGMVGMFESTLRVLGLAMFLKHDKKGFKEYRQGLKQQSEPYNMDDEVSRWGCNHLQVASVILQGFGFGITRANALVNGLSSRSDVGTLDEINLARDLRMAVLWREAIQTTGAAPTVPLPPKYYPTNAVLSVAVERLTELRKNAETDSWLLKNKDDLPERFKLKATDPKPDGAAQSAVSPAGGVPENLDAELEQLLSEGEAPQE